MGETLRVATADIRAAAALHDGAAARLAAATSPPAGFTVPDGATAAVRQALRLAEGRLGALCDALSGLVGCHGDHADDLRYSARAFEAAEATGTVGG